MYLRTVFRQRQDVTKLKNDIRDVFGTRGTNIANLCNAGYFEEFFIPLYNSTKGQFRELYDSIVGKGALAVFIHQHMQDNEITSIIKTKIQLSKRYGLKWVHIHAIGRTNVGKMRACIEKEKEFFDFFEKKLYENDNILLIELLLK